MANPLDPNNPAVLQHQPNFQLYDAGGSHTMNVGNGVARTSSTIQNSRNPNSPNNSRILPQTNSTTVAIAGRNTLLNASPQHNNRANTPNSPDKRFFP